MGHHHDAEEAFQATFMVLAGKAASVQPPEMLPNWLYGVAWRTSLKMRTTIAKRRAKEVQATVVPEPKVDDSHRWDEIAPLLDRELSRLPDKYRAAVVSCDLEGRSREDAARQLGWPEGTLKVRLMQARSLLAKRLARQGVVLSVGALAAVVSQNAASAAVPATLVASTAKAAGALAVTHAVSTGAIGTKGTLLSKGFLTPLFLGKAAVAATVAGLTVATALVVTAPKKPTATPTPPPQTAELKLPVEIERALAENARQLSPLSVTYTARVVSQVSPAKTFELLEIKTPAPPELFFAAHPFVLTWQDQQFYMSHMYPARVVGDLNSMGRTEVTFDGRVFAVGSTFPVSKAANVSAPAAAPAGKMVQGQNQLGPPVFARSLVKQPAATALDSGSCGLSNLNPYFRPETGLVFAPDPHRVMVGGQIVEHKLSANSALLDFASHGGKLISVTNVALDGKPCVRIELETVNPIRHSADLVDREKMQRDLKLSPETPKRQEELLARLDEQRKLPETRRFIYFLDPQLHYAVRRSEQRYGSDTLLTRTDCSQFEQIPGRQLWLPRKVENQLHEYGTVPATVFKDAVLTQKIEVSAFNGHRVPDETFQLDYHAPGTIIRDGTDPEHAKSKDGYITYTVPPRQQDLPAVIERARNAVSDLQVGGVMPFASEPLAERFRPSAVLTIAICNLAMIGVAGVYFVWRRRRGGLA
jgi:RNA polymerase sigma factor (sigma-70 family)